MCAGGDEARQGDWDTGHEKQLDEEKLPLLNGVVSRVKMTVV